jgi:hypothetical protein
MTLPKTKKKPLTRTKKPRRARRGGSAFTRVSEGGELPEWVETLLARGEEHIGYALDRFGPDIAVLVFGPGLSPEGGMGGVVAGPRARLREDAKKFKFPAELVQDLGQPIPSDKPASVVIPTIIIGEDGHVWLHLIEAMRLTTSTIGLA